MRFKSVTLGVVLAGVALSSAALTLGRARGAAWIGQPLELVVPVQLDAGQSSDAICAQADVFYADSKQDGERIKMSVEPTAQADTFNLRVASSALIDEPVVTIYLRAGCNQTSTRRFVLLADFPSETQSPAPRVAVEAPPPPPLVAPVEAIAAQPAISANPVVASDTAEKVVKPAVTPPAKPATPPAPKPIAKPATVEKKSPPPTREAAAPAKEKAAASSKTESGKSRLKLDPLENLAERIKTLEATTSSAPLEEMVKDSQRMQQMQSDMKVLLDQAAKNEASLLAMRERLEKAESDRVPVAVVYGLGALVLLCAAGLFVLWTRRSEPNAWQQSVQGKPQAPVRHSSPVQAPLQAEAPVEQTVLVPLQKEDSELDLDVNLVDMDAESFGTLMRAQGAVSRPAALGKAHRNFNSDALYDLREQADFFAKLGKTDQAIEVLEKRIRENSQDAALLYLDLLRIANMHSLKTDFRQFRDELQKQYNAQVPEFALFRDEGRDLEAYPSLLEHIVKVWPSPTVIDIIEACVVRDPNEKNSDAFDLAAFRDLLMLHGIAYSQQYPELDSQQHVDIDV